MSSSIVSLPFPFFYWHFLSSPSLRPFFLPRSWTFSSFDTFIDPFLLIPSLFVPFPPHYLYFLFYLHFPLFLSFYLFLRFTFVTLIVCDIINQLFLSFVIWMFVPFIKSLRIILCVYFCISPECPHLCILPVAWMKWKVISTAITPCLVSCVPPPPPPSGLLSIWALFTTMPLIRETNSVDQWGG